MARRKCLNCGGDHSIKAHCREHEIARRAGKYDRLYDGEPRREANWPSGTWGHADYWLGYYVGTKRDTLMKE